MKKCIHLILTILIFAYGCGDINAPKIAISLNDSNTHDEFCLKLDRDLKIQFQTLDSLKHSTVDSDSTEIYLNQANDKIFLLLSSMVKDNEFHICNPSDSSDISYAISSDKKLALLSWDTRLGGTMCAYTSCAIFKTENEFKVKWLNNFMHDTTTEFSELNYASYSDIYSMTMKNGKTVYLTYGYGVSQTLCPWRTIKAFIISDDLDELKIFPKGKSELICDYNFTYLNPNNLPDSVIEIRFSDTKNKLEIPIIKHGRPSGKSTSLTFDGNLFKEISVASP